MLTLILMTRCLLLFLLRLSRRLMLLCQRLEMLMSNPQLWAVPLIGSVPRQTSMTKQYPASRRSTMCSHKVVHQNRSLPEVSEVLWIGSVRDKQRRPRPMLMKNLLAVVILPALQASLECQRVTKRREQTKWPVRWTGSAATTLPKMCRLVAELVLSVVDMVLLVLSIRLGELTILKLPQVLLTGCVLKLQRTRRWQTMVLKELAPCLVDLSQLNKSVPTR
mmetsp:Transcript_45459/g.110109  ORF Transcript_45459/g.110109 Transcript_45459/m.110109 type:complete len:221 (-) Transcript_45459:1218-1880(-)